MELVADANILLAALFKGAVTRELFLDARLKLYAPEYLVIEVRRLLKHDVSIQRRIGLPQKTLEETFYFLTQRIETHPQKIYISALKEACRLAPHNQDAPYLALALTFDIPLWTNDKGMRAQDKVKVYTTKELITVLGKR